MSSLLAWTIASCCPRIQVDKQFPTDATWLSEANMWSLDSSNGSVNVERAWNADKSRAYEFVQVGQRRFKRLYDQYGRLSEIGQLCMKLRMEIGDFEPYGRWYEYQDGALRRMYCYRLATDFFDTRPESRLCGDEITYSPEQPTVIHHDPCDIPCGSFVPSIPPGNYKVTSDPALFSSLKTETANFSLQMDQHISVIEDTGTLRTVNWTTAPMVRIRLASGMMVTIFGGLLAQPPQQNIDFAAPSILRMHQPPAEPNYCWSARNN